jgi:parvulin-like peptidyl-prolyl isomerase
VLKADNISRKSHVEGIGRSEEFLKAAFSADKGGAAGPVRIQNGFAVVRLDSITPIDNEVYQKDRVEFAKTLLQEKRDSAFQKWFVDMKEKSNLKDNL